MFVNSLRKVRIVQLSTSSAEPFDDVRALAQRPLEVVVIWAPEVPDELAEMTHELSLHFVGAFFRQLVRLA